MLSHACPCVDKIRLAPAARLLIPHPKTRCVHTRVDQNTHGVSVHNVPHTYHEKVYLIGRGNSRRCICVPLGAFRFPPLLGRSCVPFIWRELRGFQGMGVVNNNWFDRVLLSIICIFKTSR